MSSLIEEVRYGGSPGNIVARHTRPCTLPDLLKLSVLLVVEQQRSLCVSDAEGVLIDLRIDVPVGDEDILPAIVVEVGEPHAETEERNAHRAETRRPGQIGELALTVVVIEVIGVVRKVGL